MTRFLMVCLGNICRSPLAQGILESKLDTTMYFVDSAGTSAAHIGEHPDFRSIAVADQHRVDIKFQRSRQFCVNDFDNFDEIFVMDLSNYQNVIMLSRNALDRQKVKLILDEISPELKLEVPDPYMGSDSGFSDLYKMLDQACTEIVKRIGNDKR